MKTTLTYDRISRFHACLGMLAVELNDLINVTEAAHQLIQKPLDEILENLDIQEFKKNFLKRVKLAGKTSANQTYIKRYMKEYSCSRDHAEERLAKHLSNVMSDVKKIFDLLVE